MGMPPEFTQTQFRGRLDDDSETLATWHADAGTDFTYDTDTNLRLRILITENAGGGEASQSFKLQHNYDDEGWTDTNNASTLAIISNSSIEVADNDPTTEQMAGTGTFVGGKIETTNGGTAAIAIDASEETEMVWCIQIISGDVIDANTILFRAVQNDGTVFSDYGTLDANIPIVTINIPVIASLPASTTFVRQAVPRAATM